MINSFTGRYYFLSNFYNSTVTYDGITYTNNEAAFQAQKTENFSEKYKFGALKPSDAKKLGRSVSLRQDWEEVKYNIMFEICLAKFKQNPELALSLLETGDQHLEEGNTWGDTIWGTVNGVGENHLGKILMQIRLMFKVGD